MQLDWRPCKCRGRFDVPLGARDRIVDAVTPDGIVTDASDNIDWGKVSKWRDAQPSPSPQPNMAGIDPAVLERLEHFGRGMPKVYAGQPFDCDKDIKADVRAVIKALTPAPETRTT